MFGWLKSLFGNEAEEERIVPPPLPSKVKKAEKLVGKKIAKKATEKKEASKEETPKIKTVKVKAPNKKKIEEVKQEPVVEAEPAPVEKNKSKKSGRPRKVSS